MGLPDQIQGMAETKLEIKLPWAYPQLRPEEPLCLTPVKAFGGEKGGERLALPNLARHRLNHSFDDRSCCIALPAQNRPLRRARWADTIMNQLV